MTITPNPAPASSTPAPSCVDDRVRHARALLMRLSGGAPTPPLGELILTQGPVRAADILLDDPVTAAGYGIDADPDARALAAADLERAAALGVRLLTPEDPDWPPAAALVAWQRPTGELTALVEVAGLWVHGPASLRSLRRVAMVGSHAASDYGRWVARDWAGALTTAGITVVTGGGVGIETEALRGALAAGGAPIVIAPSGIERVHPSVNRELVEAVAARGAVVSPYPFDEPARATRASGRRAMIAGFGRDATLLVEAGVRCSALRTAHHAHALGRAVLVVPGPVTAATSSGAHRLAREPWARLVGSVDDVRADLPAQLAARGATAH